MHYSLMTNQAMKKILPLNDADLVTHLLCMCLAKWQTQYNLNTTPISTRALLPVLENIENNAEVDYKAQNPTKMKGSEVNTRWS